MGLKSMGSQTVGPDRATNTKLCGLLFVKFYSVFLK